MIRIIGRVRKEATNVVHYQIPERQMFGMLVVFLVWFSVVNTMYNFLLFLIFLRDV